MRIFPDVQVGMQQALLQVFNAGIRVQAYLHFVAYAIYIYLYKGRTFLHKTASYKRNHDGKIKEKKCENRRMWECEIFCVCKKVYGVYKTMVTDFHISMFAHVYIRVFPTFTEI